MKQGENIAAKIEFQQRPSCPACGSTKSRTVWSGQFADPEVEGFLALYHYSGDWKSGLDGQGFSLEQCSNCTMKWHSRVIDDASVATVYGQWADADQARHFEAAHVRDKADKTAQMAQMVKLVLRLRHLAGRGTEGLHILDFGCGDGLLLRVAQMLGAEAVGVDVSASRSESARRDGIRIFPDLDSLDRETKARKLDAIVLSQVLEHVAEPLGLLQALHARLRPGGVLFVAVPNTTGVTAPRDFHEFTLVQPVEHMNAFTPTSLRDLGRRAGFIPVRRPSAFFTTEARGALRAAANWIWQPKTTDVFFRAGGVPVSADSAA